MRRSIFWENVRKYRIDKRLTQEKLGELAGLGEKLIGVGESEGTPLNWEGVQSMVRRLCKRAELTGVRGSPHSFRHTFGTKMLENGANTRDIQLLMGHSTEKMSKTYQRTLDCQWAVSRHKRYSPIDNMKLK